MVYYLNGLYSALGFFSVYAVFFLLNYLFGKKKA